MDSKELTRKTNRHIARILTAIEDVCVLPAPARDIIMDGIHYIVRDLEGQTHGLDKSKN